MYDIVTNCVLLLHGYEIQQNMLLARILLFTCWYAYGVSYPYRNSRNIEQIHTRFDLRGTTYASRGFLPRGNSRATVARM